MKTNIKTAFSMVTVLVLVMFLSSFSSLSASNTILELTDSKLVIQSSLLGDRYVIVTFKRAN
mgnify:CR=1 FL=1